MKQSEVRYQVTQILFLIKGLLNSYVLFYKTDDFDGQIISSDEGECLWIDKDKLNNYKLAKDFEDMYKIFENDSLSEFFYRKKQGDWIKEFY